MGQLVDGQWHDTWYDTNSTGGKFVRSTAKFRNWITADGSAGASGELGAQATNNPAASKAGNWRSERRGIACRFMVC